MTVLVIDIALLTALACIALAIVRSANLVVLIVLAGAYSLASAAWFTAMEAVDVAFTEAAVGAGLTTLFLLCALTQTKAARAGALSSVRWRAVFALAGVAVVGALLVYASIDLPIVGSEAAVAYTHLGRQFIERTPGDIGIPNVVTAILASYRGFDTLGEVVVIFTGALAVVMLLGDESARDNMPNPVPSHEILPVVSRLMLPFIVLFALYVQFHGDYSPGGGFQAGVILATAVMLHALVAGVERTRILVPMSAARGVAAAGVWLYGAVGMASVLRGGDFLDYDFLVAGEHMGQHVGIFLVELGVLATVAGSMLSIFYALNGRATAKEPTP